MQYQNVLQKIKSFECKERDGTYDWNTGRLVTLRFGYMVTFHQNAPDGSKYGRYTEEEYDKLTNEMAQRTKSENIYVGVYRNVPEISFCCEDMETAMELMIEYNQRSIWDNQYEREIMNPKYDSNNNPI